MNQKISTNTTTTSPNPKHSFHGAEAVEAGANQRVTMHKAEDDPHDKPNAQVKKNNRRWRLMRMIVRARLMTLMVKAATSYKPKCENVQVAFVPHKLHGCYAVEVDNYKFSIKQRVENTNYFLHVEESSKNLEEWIANKPFMHLAFKNTKFEKLVPTQNSKQLVKMIITEFLKMEERHEYHYDLYSLKNYRLQLLQTQTNSEEDDEQKFKVVGVKIIHDHTSIRQTTTYKERLEAIIHIIFNDIFGGQNNLVEWEDFKRILQELAKMQESAKSVKLLHNAKNHVCFWSYKERLLVFVDLTTAVEGETAHRRSMAQHAIKSCSKLMANWEQKVRKYDPLASVLDYSLNKKVEDDYTDLVKVNEYGLIRFLRNCYNHLTCWKWDLNSAICNKRIFNHVKESDDPEFKKLHFLDHIITYFLFPNIYFELQAALGPRFVFLFVKD